MAATRIAARTTPPNRASGDRLSLRRGASGSNATSSASVPVAVPSPTGSTETTTSLMPPIFAQSSMCSFGDQSASTFSGMRWMPFVPLISSASETWPIVAGSAAFAAILATSSPPSASAAGKPLVQTPKEVPGGMV